jgi:LysM repeat protein
LHRDRRLILLAVLSALAGLLTLSDAAYGSGTAHTSTVRVQSGQTLWDLAASAYPGDDIRQRVVDIESANGLAGPVVITGQELRLP